MVLNTLFQIKVPLVLFPRQNKKAPVTKIHQAPIRLSSMLAMTGQFRQSMKSWMIQLHQKLPLRGMTCNELAHALRAMQGQNPGFTHPTSSRVWASEWSIHCIINTVTLCTNIWKNPWWSEKWGSDALVRRWAICLRCPGKQISYAYTWKFVY